MPGASCESTAPIGLHDGTARVQDNNPSSPDRELSFDGVSGSQVIYGRVGAEDTDIAALDLHCGVYHSMDSGTILESFAIFDGQHGKLHQLGVIIAHIQPMSTKVHPSLLNTFHISDGVITVEEDFYGPGDCNACPSGTALSTWTFTAGTLHRTATRIIPTAKQISVTGLDGNIYDLSVWAQDRITNCAGHAYGNAMIGFLRAHPCTGAHRVLATLTVDGRTAVLSVITVDFGPSAGDEYGYDANVQFQELENASGTGGMNDLLREGHCIRGVAASIPSTEAFTVTGQDAGAAVFDAWWATGTTPDQDPALVDVENALFLTDIG